MNFLFFLFFKHSQKLFIPQTHPILLESWAVVPKYEARSTASELCQAQDGQVLMVEATVVSNLLFHLPHYWQNPGLRIICAVC